MYPKKLGVHATINKRGFEVTIYLSLNTSWGGGCFATYELKTETYIHPFDPTNPGNLDKLRGKMRLFRDDSYATKEHREGSKGFVTYELPSAIYIYSLHPNTNANFKILTKKWKFEGTIHKWGFESLIYTSRNTRGGFRDISITNWY